LLGELGAVPASAECHDEGDGGVHATAQDIDIVALVDEGRVLGGDDLEVGVDAADVAVVEDALGLKRGGGCGVLLGGLVSEDVEGDQVVLDLLEGSEDGLLVSGGVAIKESEGFGLDALAAATIEDGEGEARAERIDGAGGREDGRNSGGGGVAERTGEQDGGIERSLGDADSFIAFVDAAFGGSDIGAALEEFGGGALVSSGERGMLRSAGDLPMSTAIACSYCARSMAMSEARTRA
jgi:hypothetical protein